MLSSFTKTHQKEEEEEAGLATCIEKAVISKRVKMVRKESSGGYYKHKGMSVMAR